MGFSDLSKALTAALPEFLARQRWFGGKARPVRSLEVLDIVPVEDILAAGIVLVRVSYADKLTETYSLPYALATERNAPLGRQVPAVELELQGRRVKLEDALWDKRFCLRLLRAIERSETWAGATSKIILKPGRAFSGIRTSERGNFDPFVLRGEQSNTSVVYGDRLILKFFRRLEPGVNPDLEIGAFLTEKTSFRHTPRLAGSCECQLAEGSPYCLGILQEFVPNQGDAWKYTLAEIHAFFERARGVEFLRAEARGTNPPREIRDLMGSYFEDAALLARRTAELHAALASSTNDPAFVPEPFTAGTRDALIRSMADLASRVFALLRERGPSLSLRVRRDAENVLAAERAVQNKFQALDKMNLDFMRVRIHGDYHLGQVLRAGNDFVIIDFEGEPARSLSERRVKRSPLQDVAGMVRSFHYAALTGLANCAPAGGGAPAADDRMESFARLWFASVSARFIASYFDATTAAPFIPREPEARQSLLECFLLEKAVYELGYELNNRPDWVRLPLAGILDLMGGSGTTGS